MRDCDPAGSCFEHTSPASIFSNAEARACSPLEAGAAACLGCWCRAQTHSTGLSPPVCVCSISAHAAVLHTPPGSFGSVPVGHLTSGCFSFRLCRSSQKAGPLWASRSSHFDLQHAADPSDVTIDLSTIRRLAVADVKQRLAIEGVFLQDFYVDCGR